MRKVSLLAITLSLALQAQGFNPAMQEYINTLKSQAKQENPNFKDFDATRGEKIFTLKNKGKNDEMISCQSCHGSNLKQGYTNAFTGKSIAPLSPSANPARLSDVKEVKKWLKRNFKDVFLREGSATEKGDVLYYLINQ